MTSTDPTCGELERSLVQNVQALYRRLLGHRPQRIICHLFADKLAIVVEDVVTPVERILLQESRSELPQLVRDSIDNALKSHLKMLIEEILKVPTVELLYDTTLETGYTGILAILTRTPQVRNPSAIPKGKLERTNDRDRPTRE